jgi:hypothetical protein
MDLKSFDDPKPAAPADAARAQVRTQGNRIRARRRLALSTPVVLVVAAAIAIPIAVTTSNNRSDIQRIEPITSATPSDAPTSMSPTSSSSVTAPSVSVFSTNDLPTLDTPLADGKTLGAAWDYDFATPAAAPKSPSPPSSYTFFCGEVPGTDTKAKAAFATGMERGASGNSVGFTAIEFSSVDQAQTAVTELEAALARCDKAPDGSIISFTAGRHLQVEDGAQVYIHTGTEGTPAYLMGIGRSGSRVSVVIYGSQDPAVTAELTSRFASTVTAAVSQLTH